MEKAKLVVMLKMPLCYFLTQWGLQEVVYQRRFLIIKKLCQALLHERGDWAVSPLKASKSVPSEAGEWAGAGVRNPKP